MLIIAKPSQAKPSQHAMRNQSLPIAHFIDTDIFSLSLTYKA